MVYPLRVRRPLHPNEIDTESIYPWTVAPCWLQGGGTIEPGVKCFNCEARTYHASVHPLRAGPATCPPPGRVCAQWEPNSPANPLALCPVHTCVLACQIPGEEVGWSQDAAAKSTRLSLTLRSFKQLELSTTNNVRSAQPMRFIAGLGDCQREIGRERER